jgi:hypothetical protein
MSTSFDSPLELPQIVVDATEPGGMTAPSQPATRAAALRGGDDDL